MSTETEPLHFYYCNDNETVEGPYAWEQLLELYGNGIISSTTAICQAGAEDWTAFGNFMLAEEQVLEASMAVAEELPEPAVTSDPVPVTYIQSKTSRMTPKLWAVAAGTAALVAILAYASIRMFQIDKKPPVAEAATLAVSPGKPLATAPPTALSATPSSDPEIIRLQQDAEKGDVVAAYKLGIKYRDGDGVAKNREQALLYLQKAAEAGNIWGQISLAGMYAQSGSRDEAKHFSWIEKAANKGDQLAMFVAALCNADGVGTPKNPQQATRWAIKAANTNPAKAQEAAAGADRWMSMLRDRGEARSSATDLLGDARKNRGADAFQISVLGSSVTVDRLGRGPIGVVFFGHSGSKEMKDVILAGSAAFSDLLPDKCSFFLWEYPKSSPFDQVQRAINSYMQGDKDKIRPDFSGIAGQVLSQIRDKTGLTEFLLVGNSLGAGTILWDYKALSADPNVRFLLISPTETFMPPVSSLGDLERTMLLSATGTKGDPQPDRFLQGPEASNWVRAQVDRDAADKITSTQPENAAPRNFTHGHKIIGIDIDFDLLSKLIKVNLGLTNREALAEPKEP